MSKSQVISQLAHVTKLAQTGQHETRMDEIPSSIPDEGNFFVDFIFGIPV